jgi:hypothetical protein
MPLGPINSSGITQADLDLKAPLASPALTGTPTAPTQTTGDNSTKLATTAFVSKTVRKIGHLSSASFTLVLTLVGQWIRMIGFGTHTLIIPANATTAFPIGSILYIEQTTADATTLEAADGVTLLGGPTTAGQNTVMTLCKVESDTWIALGGTT